MSEKVILEGGCLCGDIRYQTTALPFNSDHCHCSMCRKTTGAVVGTWVDFKIEEVMWLNTKPLEYASSNEIRRGFCPSCGSSVSFRHIEHPEYITLSTGSLDEPDKAPAKIHIHVADKVSWLNIDDDCKRFVQGVNSQLID